MLGLNKKSLKLFNSINLRMFSDSILFSFVEKGIEKKIIAQKGERLLDLAKKYKINLEGACEGNCACSTCHVIFNENLYDKLPKPTEEEEDMLELAFGLTPTSRLACQVKVDKNFMNQKIIIPDKQRNFSIERMKAASEFKKKLPKSKI